MPNKRSSAVSFRSLVLSATQWAVHQQRGLRAATGSGQTPIQQIQLSKLSLLMLVLVAFARLSPEQLPDSAMHLELANDSQRIEKV